MKDFIVEIQEWYDDNYLEDDVWKRLRRHVSPEVLEQLSNREPLMIDEQSPKLEPLSKMKAELKAASNIKEEVADQKTSKPETLTALTTVHSKGLQTFSHFRLLLSFPLVTSLNKYPGISIEIWLKFSFFLCK